ncbi:MAG: vWA domain-containing protein [Deltaproteobacteria bacterium]|nr:vWA domain-containing protein [Deltaproteobacteria bacterium]
MMLRTWFAAAIAVMSVACSEPMGRFNLDGGSGGEGGMSSMDGGFVMPEAGPRPDRDPTMIDPDAACATQNSPTTRAPMNLLILLDRSGSMDGCATGGSGSCGGRTKWAAAQQGIVSLLRALEDDARVGLMFFPASSNASSADGYRRPAAPIAPLRMNRDTLIGQIMGARPTGNTPMACAMPGAIEYFRSMFTENGSRNIMLITDGEPSDECSGAMCSPFDITCLINASSLAKAAIQGSVVRGARNMPTIRTFALGTPDADPAFLSSVAINGGSARMAGCEPNDCHYTLGTATFEADLNRALDSVRDRAGTCEFELMVDRTMADPGLINVYYTPMGGTGRLVPRDTSHTNGWDFAPGGMSIVFYGMLCDEIRSGRNSGSNVRIIYGCPTIIPG